MRPEYTVRQLAKREDQARKKERRRCMELYAITCNLVKRYAGKHHPAYQVCVDIMWAMHHDQTAYEFTQNLKEADRRSSSDNGKS